MPFQLIAALEKDHYRKPMTGMFEYYAEQLKQQGVAVGQAAVSPESAKPL